MGNTTSDVFNDVIEDLKFVVDNIVTPVNWIMHGISLDDVLLLALHKAEDAILPLIPDSRLQELLKLGVDATCDFVTDSSDLSCDLDTVKDLKDTFFGSFTKADKDDPDVPSSAWQFAFFVVNDLPDTVTMQFVSVGQSPFAKPPPVYKLPPQGTSAKLVQTQVTTAYLAAAARNICAVGDTTSKFCTAYIIQFTLADGGTYYLDLQSANLPTTAGASSDTYPSLIVRNTDGSVSLRYKFTFVNNPVSNILTGVLQGTDNYNLAVIAQNLNLTNYDRVVYAYEDASVQITKLASSSLQLATSYTQALATPLASISFQGPPAVDPAIALVSVTASAALDSRLTPTAQLNPPSSQQFSMTPLIPAAPWSNVVIGMSPTVTSSVTIPSTMFDATHYSVIRLAVVPQVKTQQYAAITIRNLDTGAYLIGRNSGVFPWGGAYWDPNNNFVMAQSHIHPEQIWCSPKLNYAAPPSAIIMEFIIWGKATLQVQSVVKNDSTTLLPAIQGLAVFTTPEPVGAVPVSYVLSTAYVYKSDNVPDDRFVNQFTPSKLVIDANTNSFLLFSPSVYVNTYTLGSIQGQATNSVALPPQKLANDPYAEFYLTVACSGSQGFTVIDDVTGNTLGITARGAFAGFTCASYPQLTCSGSSSAVTTYRCKLVAESNELAGMRLRVQSTATNIVGFAVDRVPIATWMPIPLYRPRGTPGVTSLDVQLYFPSTRVSNMMSNCYGTASSFRVSPVLFTYGNAIPLPGIADPMTFSGVLYVSPCEQVGAILGAFLAPKQTYLENRKKRHPSVTHVHIPRIRVPQPHAPVDGHTGKTVPAALQTVYFSRHQNPWASSSFRW